MCLTGLFESCSSNISQTPCHAIVSDTYQIKRIKHNECAALLPHHYRVNVQSKSDLVPAIGFKKADPHHHIRHAHSPVPARALTSTHSRSIAFLHSSITLKMSPSTDPAIPNVYRTPDDKTDFDGNGAFAECVQLYVMALDAW